MLLDTKVQKESTKVLNVFRNMCDALFTYLESIAKTEKERLIVGTADLTADMLFAVMGICKGDFNHIVTVANRIGQFDKRRIKQMAQILKRF